MNCPSCGTDEFYEGFLSRECKKLGCKLYTEKHAEACRKADVEMDNEGPAKQTQAPDWAYTTLGLPVPNRLGGISWNHPNNTVQPKGTGGGIPYMLNTPRLYEQRTGVITIDDGSGMYTDVTPVTVTATHVKAAQMIDTNHPSKDSARLCQLMITWLGAKTPTKTTSQHYPVSPLIAGLSDQQIRGDALIHARRYVESMFNYGIGSQEADVHEEAMMGLVRAYRIAKGQLP